MLILQVMGLQVGFACTVTHGQRSPYHSPGQYKLSRRLPPQQLLPHNTEYSGHSPHTDKLSAIAHITPPHLRRESTNTPTPEFSIYSYSGGRNPFSFFFSFFPTLLLYMGCLRDIFISSHLCRNGAYHSAHDCAHSTNTIPPLRSVWVAATS